MDVARDREPTVVAPGNHDGVHLGHQALARAARAHGAQIGAKSVAITFDPHPAAVLAPERAPEALTTPERRVALLRTAGVDDARVIAFDAAFARKTAEQFARDVLVSQLGARGVVCGADFRFGAGRSGDVETLGRLGASLGFFVDVVAPVEMDGAIVSSTRIRQALREGDVASAARWLGRLPEVAGEVIAGDKRGRTIGFPTANLASEPVLLPKDGVYAVVARIGDRFVQGAMNIGSRPTFRAGRSVEIHFLDFEGDLYGRAVRVGVAARLRDERKFEGLDALRHQLATDVSDARARLADVTEEQRAWL